MKQTYFKIQLISSDAIIPITAAYIANAVKKLGVSEKRAYQICFFVESALELRFKQIDTDNPYVELEVSTDNDLVFISILDKGLPYVFTKNQEKIMKKGLVDGYRLEQLGRDGQRSVFTFKMDEMHDMPVPKLEEETLLDFNITSRRTRTEDSDINELIKCLYSVFGYTYTYQSLYRIDEVKKSIESGRYVSMLAENEHGQVLGHIALSESSEFKGMFESCNLVTKPIARGHHVASKLFEFNVKTIYEIDAEGCFGEAVCIHTISQKFCKDASFTPSGFVFNYVAPWNAGQYGEGGFRLDVALFVIVKDKAKLHTLYVADEIKNFVADIFDSEKLTYVFADSKTPLPEKSIMSIDVDAYAKFGKTMMDVCGKDFCEKLDRFLEMCSQQDIEMCNFYLNLNDKGAIEAYEILHERGFMVTGIIPGSKNGDYLLLQILNSPHDKKNFVYIDVCAEMYEKIKKLSGGKIE